ncbi:hypothetical protein JOL79_02010 [Microbispora sp. RL4-1S]|uniref:DUF4350 domain-containing protein n=1 Tax=Microbispora oryzae TaxID=2806554 RepID=A0A940WBS9_9ACTN|nr:DUF6421 family protein [Microbispora oryzae]MBP2702575.1 hypothetical protein [Microbispora oryzae]
MKAFPSVLFDEAHSEAWTIRRDVAETMNPAHPDDNSYAEAAGVLRRLGHTVAAHTEGPITAALLGGRDVFVVAHPSGERWERTTGVGRPVFTAEEIDVLDAYVRDGGGLIVLAECEHDKYGSNLGDLLARFGVAVEHTTVQDPAHCHNRVATWIMGVPAGGAAAEGPDAGVRQDLLAEVRQACFYRAGGLRVPAGATVLFETSPTADPAGRPLAAAVRHGRGRVVVLADSDLFGDDSISDYDHAQLWTNLVTWAARVPDGRAASGRASREEVAAEFAGLKSAVERLRPLQAKDGSISGDKDLAVELLSDVAEHIKRLAPHFPHDRAYLDTVVCDIGAWVSGGLGVPDFLDSLEAFHPDTRREDGLEHLVLFPMYTQNGNRDRNLEAVWIRVVWPDWLAELERNGYDNPMFVPIAFEDFTSGYDTNSAVLFPETVAVRHLPPRFTWGGIFCDREAARFRVVSQAAVATLKLSLPPDAARLLASQDLAQDTFVLWDLVHDRTHSHGDLPFDPFMIKQRMPYWLYSLEELRCDLTAFGEAVKLEVAGVPHARLVQYAILFDRLFRFPITGERVRNYDGLGGQLLFAYLHRRGVVRWTDNRLSIDWARVADRVADLRGEVETLYRDGIDRSKTAHWLAAHRLVAGYVEPNPASAWHQGIQALPAEQKAMVDAVLPDEFPLSMFYEALRRKLADVVESTKGIRAR